MPANTTLTATLPDGTVATRKTARTYTHVVTCLTTGAELAAKRAQALASAQAYLAREQAANGLNIGYAERKLAEAEADAAQPATDTWGVWAWSGRADLAAKEAEKARRVYATVRVVPVG